MAAFALNHMTVAGRSFAELCTLAARLGCVGVEARNDLPGPLFDGADTPPARGSLRLLAVAEVKRFNDWSEARRTEAADLIATAARAGAEAIALIPRNDMGGMGNGERQANLRVALRELKPMLDAAGLIGLVEPLGFETCALRHKSEAVEAIEALGAAATFRIVHDTFHHHLAGGGPLFAEHTGLVHISGVTDPALATRDMRDEHRGLVDAQDRLGTVDQLAALAAAGYDGPISFECFAPSVHALDDPETALRHSIDFIRARLLALAA